MSRRYHTWLALAGLTTGCALSLPSAATDLQQATRSLQPKAVARVTGRVESVSTFALPGTAPTSALAKHDAGAIAPAQTIDNLTLLLKRDDDTEKAFRTFLAAQKNPASPEFHHWLTAKELGERFGPAPQDVESVQQWLRSQGLTIARVSSDRMRIEFSGPAASVSKAFGTELRHYDVDGQRHFAANSATRVPAALSTVVQGVTLHDFFPTAQHTKVGTSTFDAKAGKWSGAQTESPSFTVPPGTANPHVSYNLVPADFAQVYNVKPLWERSQPLRGAGQTIAVLGRSDVQPQDVASFRKAFLPPDAQGRFSILHPTWRGEACKAPGLAGDEAEAALDVQWAGAAAPDADIVLATCADEGATFGAFQAASRLLEPGPYGELPPPVWNLSYGSCESADPSNAFLADVLWSSAAAEGVTVFVASGDAGSTACDQGALFWSTSGAAVNGLASSPSAVAVGGTDFDDLGQQSRYWTSSNLPYYQSAIGYIPEMTWNNTCASSHLYTLLGYEDGVTACNDEYGPGASYTLVAGAGGGASITHGQPVAQIGIAGSTNHASRTLPDVSLFAGNGLYGHALVFCMSDAANGGTGCNFGKPNAVFANSAGGTSFAAPAMAGVQALINQASGGRNGNMLPALYGVAARQYGTVGSPNADVLRACNSSSGATIGAECVFNNVTEGDIVQPCGAGSPNCDTGRKLNNVVGIVRAGDPTTNTLVPAWQANVGYSMATGLGTINAANLVDAVVDWNAPARRAYTAPADYLALNQLFTGDGYSDFAYVDPTRHVLHSVAMKGAVSLFDEGQTLSADLDIVTYGDVVPGLNALSLHSGELLLVGSDNRLHVWVSAATGGYFTFTVADPIPDNYRLLGVGVHDPSGVQKLIWYDTKTSRIAWWALDLDPATQNDIIVVGKSWPVDGIAGATPTLADVNGDGYTDLVWTATNRTGVALWISNQHGGFSKRALGDRAAGDTLYGVGDIDGNGTTDLIWTNATSGQLSWWTMDGFRIAGRGSEAIPAGLSIAGIGDYDGDGRADILWRDAEDRIVQWQRTKTGFASFRVADAYGEPLVIGKDATIPANRFQGGRRVTPAL
ncbi:Repeat domain-containing protein [Luteibacter sp. UNC138MFCol5.1]|uniref:protease pro-enzyme activation domain-containing protein n=1 Tax=Luteibacter sp. UNC138MFCol5.1 TaxID=1502774 RepID=UPI0008B83E8D|nr:protease pro-enzyme activation domain-containing protein [Luteibacter sp. UNC138MFCol5.1]SEO35628.1 Repeat domain-containing protein [Luteibacter sp. UNC138MFCol5.1]